jgi:hypothetical protein
VAYVSDTFLGLFSPSKLQEGMGSDNGLLAQLFKLSWLSNILWGGTGILTCVLGALYVYQDNLLYHPVIPGVPKSPKENPKGYR